MYVGSVISSHMKRSCDKEPKTCEAYEISLGLLHVTHAFQKESGEDKNKNNNFLFQNGRINTLSLPSFLSSLWDETKTSTRSKQNKRHMRAEANKTPEGTSGTREILVFLEDKITIKTFDRKAK